MAVIHKGVETADTVLSVIMARRCRADGPKSAGKSPLFVQPVTRQA